MGRLRAPTWIKTSVDAWLGAGVPASKLGIGAGFYGLCYTSPVTAPKQEPRRVDREWGRHSLAYRELLASYITPQARQWDSTAQVPYLSFSAPTGPGACTYLSYTDEQSLAAQADYVKSKGLGGVVV